MTTPTHVGSAFAPRDVAVLLALASMWGFSFLFIKIAVPVVSPLWIVVARCVIGGLVLLVALRIRGTSLPRGVRAWRDLAVLAVLGNALPWGLMAWATQHLPSGLVAVVNALSPTSTSIIAIVVGLEFVSVRRVGGLILALAGTTVAVSGNLGAPGTVTAVLATVLATVCYGIATVYAKQRVSGRYPPLAIATGQVVGAAVISLPVVAVLTPPPDVTALSGPVIGSLLALGALGTGTAFLAYYVLIARVGATNTIMVTYLIPVVALVAGGVVLGEPLTLVVVVGTALTILGIWLAQRERRTVVVEPREPVAG